jgi:hypothetical protein
VSLHFVQSRPCLSFSSLFEYQTSHAACFNAQDHSTSALYPCLYYDCAGPRLNCSNGEGDQFDKKCLRFLLVVFVGWSAMKTL